MDFQILLGKIVTLKPFPRDLGVSTTGGQFSKKSPENQVSRFFLILNHREQGKKKKKKEGNERMGTY